MLAKDKLGRDRENREADRKEQTERQAEAEEAGGAGSNATERRGTGRDRQERNKQRGGKFWNRLHGTFRFCSTDISMQIMCM
jgi:hypothetical protein